MPLHEDQSQSPSSGFLSLERYLDLACDAADPHPAPPTPQPLAPGVEAQPPRWTSAWRRLAAQRPRRSNAWRVLGLLSLRNSRKLGGASTQR